MSDESGVRTTLGIPVRSSDIDGEGIVNNAVFYEYFEQSRLEHLYEVGVNRPAPGQPPYDRRFTIVETRCRYHAPVGFRETLLVETRTVKVGRSSFTLAYRALKEGDGTLVAEGESVQVWLGPDGRSAPIPDDMRANLEASLIAPEPEAGSER